jgi:flagellar protein FlaG
MMRVPDTSNVTSAPPVVEQKVGSSAAITVKVALPTQVKDTKSPSPEALKASVDKINEELKQNKVNLDFSIDNKSKEVVVKVIDTSTGDVLTQFPSKQALAISESIANKQKGSFLNDKA